MCVQLVHLYKLTAVCLGCCLHLKIVCMCVCACACMCVNSRNTMRILRSQMVLEPDRDATGQAAAMQVVVQVTGLASCFVCLTIYLMILK